MSNMMSPSIFQNQAFSKNDIAFVFGFRKLVRKEKNVKKNDFLIFNCLIKKIRLCLVLPITKSIKENNFHV